MRRSAYARGHGAVLETRTVPVGPYEVLLTRKRIKRAYLRVDDDTGSVRVSAPPSWKDRPRGSSGAGPNCARQPRLHRGGVMGPRRVPSCCGGCLHPWLRWSLERRQSQTPIPTVRRSSWRRP